MSQILTVAATSAFLWSSISSAWDSLTVVQVAAVISAAILTFGAILEYWEKLKLLALLLTKCAIRRATQFDRCVLRRILVHSIGPILVVLGIAGEVVFEGRAFILEDRQEAQVEATTAVLRDKAALNERAAADEALARAKIEETIAWRRLPKEKRSLVASRVNRFPRQVATLWYSFGDKEAETFAFEIANALHDAGWTVYSPAGIMDIAESGHLLGTVKSLETGVQVSAPQAGIGNAAGSAVVRALTALGFDAALLDPSRRGKNAGEIINVEVHVRPEGPQGEAKLRRKAENKQRRATAK